MANKDDYQEFLKGKFTSLIDSLNLSELQTQFLFSRWLDQMLWMEAQAGKSRNRYYRLRLITIIGGVVLPALVSLNINSSEVREIFVWATFSLSQIVAISAAVEEFFHYGERWRHYRRTAESLKTQGWQFFQLTGPYVNYGTHDKAFSSFANQVEEIIQRDVEVYATQVVQEKKQQENGNDDKQDNVKENKESKV
ncbi:conserved hypothetical protein [Trichormus variabilis ATCC 29413]|uniref:DUF4231 domain-containing protein n=3 Tax=Nostocales TaxID=1161 RepID=Q3M5F8_TRIV2|nr:DUF4231 domain-containing protein [Trichormus variabilis]ABA23778.1 conserved hypothetical protein [Trichormus variabilis ATCC 29413]MBC1213931.1 DUF4231 domain-containing protein [Trichormus variabilis ARAD]MBC1265878.1 DUF4231 domain-containing protein [Trichormus variabilis FSR]MBC1311027.1 DUF4231 domain-containing protein [Trichormus variabilis PNB]MBC1325358.1 DUF4231 domain-containing protein [Trichormus variabilis 9RC]QFZ15824.1 DUF4231 domain-containing protein [Anabaena sp. YBS01